MDIDLLKEKRVFMDIGNKKELFLSVDSKGNITLSIDNGTILIDPKGSNSIGIVVKD